MDIPPTLPPLPPRLAERTIGLNAAPVVPDRRFVLCWLHHAVRDVENPVLDAAIEIGNAIGRPVLVYQGLGGRHRFNADRHHAFIMEGARDLQAGLARRGVAGVFSLPRHPALPSPMRRLLGDACAFVAEDFPAPPFPAWTARLAARATCAAVAVDAACVLPLRRLGKRFTRAFEFRDAARPHWAERIAEPWIDAVPSVAPPETSRDALGFTPADLRTADLADLAAACAIDHAVPPVAGRRGGAVAGNARWRAFRDEHLRRYAKRRNDALDPDAVSGLSPYLHHGHVSPFHVAREAHATGGEGAEKFLDELLVWRELAFNFCAHTPADELESLAALPDWARRTLEAHADDPRASFLSWETMSRGRTGDALWDAAQRSLVRNGELHNNLRMTWGKAVPGWTRTPAVALRRLIDLNHRFALDGSDPNSYGGILWCLGQFDRPFTPEQPVLGTVRGRSTDDHARRLDPARFAAAVRERHGAAPLRAAVVGAGIAGLACARTLRDHGCDVVVFDRGRGPGGRTSTRRSTLPDGRPVTFDHGAPHFTVTDERFARFVRSWIHDGVCALRDARRAVWRDGRLRDEGPARRCVVGVPGMNAVCRHLADGLDVRCGAAVGALVPDGRGWRLAVDADDDDGRTEGPFDAVVVAAPAPQATRLVAAHAAALAEDLAGIETEPIWVGMLVLDGGPSAVPDWIEVENDPVVARLLRDETKPGRASEPGVSRWVVHARPEWSAARYDTPRVEIAGVLVDAARRLLGAVAGTDPAEARVVFSAAHRWGLARTTRPVDADCLFDADARLAVCGDGCGGTDIEAAFLGGHAAAGRVLSLRTARSAASTVPATLFAERTP